MRPHHILMMLLGVAAILVLLSLSWEAVQAKPALQATATPNSEVTNRSESSPPEFIWRTDGGDNPLRRPKDIAVDSENNVYVVDGNEGRIQKYDSDGNFLMMWGSPSNADGKFVFRLEADHPSAMAINSHDILHVVDANGFIQMFDTEGSFLGQWGSGRGSDEGQFIRPHCIGIDSQDNLYISDYVNAHIQVFDSTGNLLAVWNQDTMEGLNSPGCLAFDPEDNVYILNEGRVKKFDQNGQFLMAWDGAASGALFASEGLAIDPSGAIYVGDNPGNRILKFDTEGNFICQWGSYGRGDGQFDRVFQLAVDHAGFIYVTSDGGNDRLQKFQSCLPPDLINPTPTALPTATQTVTPSPEVVTDPVFQSGTMITIEGFRPLFTQSTPGGIETGAICTLGITATIGQTVQFANGQRWVQIDCQGQTGWVEESALVE